MGYKQGGVWSSAGVYALGDQKRGSDGKIYERITSTGGSGGDPTTSGNTNWKVVGSAFVVGAGADLGPITARVAALEANPGAPINDALVGTTTTLSSARVGSLLAGTQPRLTGVLAPWYIYPADIYNNTVYGAVYVLGRKYPGLLNLILNNSNGPGAAIDGNFTEAILRLQAAGIPVGGYVTSRMQDPAFPNDPSKRVLRPIADVKAEIASWKTWYKPNFIFVDEGSSDTTASVVAYYQALTDYIHSLGMLSADNIGADYTAAYESIADYVVIHENSYYPSLATLQGIYQGGHLEYSSRNRAILVYGQATLDLAQVAQMRQYAGFIYVTDDSGTNPWDNPSSYLEPLLQALSPGGGSATSTLPVYTAIAGSDRRLTASGTAQGLGSLPSGAVAAVIQPQGGDVYFTTTGSTPSATVGQTLTNGSSYELQSLATLQAFQFVDGGNAAVLALYFEANAGGGGTSPPSFASIAGGDRTVNMSGSPVGLGGSFPTGTGAAQVQAIGGDVTYTVTGTAPTLSTGQVLYQNTIVRIDTLAELTAFQAIAANGVSLAVTFETRTN